MLHRGCPDETGWYWIEDAGLWYMAYLDAEGDPPRLVLAKPEREELTLLHRFDDDLWRYPGTPPEEWGWEGPEKWIGPLACPGGDFGREIVEFGVEQHTEAAAAREALVMVATDMTHSDAAGGTVVCTGRVSGRRAYTIAGEFFRGTMERSRRRWRLAALALAMACGVLLGLLVAVSRGWV